MTPAKSSSSDSQNHRQLLQDSACTLYRKSILYGPTKEHPDGYHTESWACELSNDEAKKINAKFVDIEESSLFSGIVENAISGQSVLSVSQAIVDGETKSDDSPKMYLPENASIDLHSDSASAIKIQAGPSTTGTLTALVVRLSDRNNVSPDDSASQMYNDVFGDEVCLKSHMEACSYGKLKIEPFIGRTPSNYRVENGIVEVTMTDYDVNSNGDRQTAAFKATQKLIGDLGHSMFDLVMFCYPRGKTAYAYVNSKFSFYSNNIKAVSLQMHEVGHNLGLAHSGQEGYEYGDRTGVMGYGRYLDDERFCYNPQKNYQLGWYMDKAETINPLDGSREFILNGISDYNNNSQDALVVLRLDQTSKEGDYYIGFNRAQGIHSDTPEDQNMVTIVRKEHGPLEYGQSWKVAALKPGEKHTIERFNGGNEDVSIVFLHLKNGADATVRITTDNDDEPTQSPTCEKRIRVELMTDAWPEDNSWFLEGDNKKEIAATETFIGGNKLFQQEVCLPENCLQYTFTILDSYGDGITGDGYYRVYDNCGTMVVNGADDESFFKREHKMAINDSCGDEPPVYCEDKAQEPFQWKKKGKKRSCKHFAKKNKCNKKIRTSDGRDTFVWQLCEKSCERCGA